MGPIVGIGFGPAASPAYVVTLGFGIGAVVTVPSGGSWIEPTRGVVWTDDRSTAWIEPPRGTSWPDLR